MERVRTLGLQRDIHQQLRPDRLRDEALSSRLASLETLNLSSREIVRDYILPVQLLRRQQEQAQGAGAAQETARARTPEQMEAARAERTVMMDLSEQKMLRAVYSERQLEEVLVDFWFNHFNVFAGKGATAAAHRVRARGDPAARARQVPRSARRHREEPGDAVLSRQLA